MGPWPISLSGTYVRIGTYLHHQFWPWVYVLIRQAIGQLHILHLKNFELECCVIAGVPVNSCHTFNIKFPCLRAETRVVWADPGLVKEWWWAVVVIPDLPLGYAHILNNIIGVVSFVQLECTVRVCASILQIMASRYISYYLSNQIVSLEFPGWVSFVNNFGDENSSYSYTISSVLMCS